jgi:hypothetical protein
VLLSCTCNVIPGRNWAPGIILEPGRKFMLGWRRGWC